MHIPVIRMDCWAAKATERPWLFQDRYRIRKDTPHPVDGATLCRAFISQEDMRRINGDSCDGCARMPEFGGDHVAAL